VVNESVGNNLSYTFGSDLPANSSYYWRVSVYGSNGHFSPWSAVRTFRMSMLAPVVVGPANGLITQSHRPTFSWQPVDGVTNYSLQISLSPAFSGLFLTKTVNGLSYTMLTDLPHAIIYWRVRANGPNGPSPWSAGFFTIIP
jgi:hypothetical protein